MSSGPAASSEVSQFGRFRLDGQTAVIAGGTGGIGLPVSQALNEVGASVAVVGRSPERIAQAEEAFAGTETAVVMGADVTKKAESERVVAETLDRFGRLDILVNAVGGGAGEVLFEAEEYPEEAWDWIFNLNLDSALFMSQAAASAMIKGGNGGRILNISSVRGELGIRLGYSAYVAAKGALNMLTKQHATEWAPHAITVNAISPTFVRTPQVESLLADEEFRKGLVARIPLGRIAEPDDLIGAVLFFCSSASSFVTGQILTLDGGLTACQ